MSAHETLSTDYEVDLEDRDPETEFDTASDRTVQKKGTLSMLTSALRARRKRTDAESGADTVTPYIIGFIIGWCTWLFGSVLGLFAGRGPQARALRKGLLVGAVAVTLPFAALIGLVAFFINRWNAFLDKFNFF